MIPTLLHDEADFFRRTLARLLEQLRDHVHGDAGGALDAVLAQIAIAMAQWVALGDPVRTLLIAATGSGKTHLARTLANALGVPYSLVAAPELAENNWQGPQLGDALVPLLRTPLPPADSFGNVAVPQGIQAAHGLLVVDELDKLALTSAVGVQHARESASWRIGRQESLLNVLDPAGVVRVHVSRGTGPLQIATAGLGIVAAGAFGELGTRSIVRPRELVTYGLLPELVDRLGTVHVLPPLAQSIRRRLIDVRLTRTQAIASALGVPSCLDGIGHRLDELDANHFAGPRGLIAHAESLAHAKIAEALVRLSEGDVSAREVEGEGSGTTPLNENSINARNHEHD